MDLLIRVFEAIDAGGLSSSIVESALKFIRPFVKEPLRFCGRSLLSSIQLEHLVPLLQSAERSIQSIRDPHESLFFGWTEEEVNNPLFPRLFVKQWELLNASALLNKTAKTVSVCGEYCGNLFKGEYEQSLFLKSDVGGLVFLSSEDVNYPAAVGHLAFDSVVIQKRHNKFESAESNGCWTISLEGAEDNEDVDYPMWVAPKSQHMILPPVAGWIPAKNERADLPHLSFPGISPKIRYE